MPKVVVEGPDGRKFAFPDTMPRAEINAFMKQKYGTKARDESVQDYLARFGREQAATEARAKDIDREATAAGRAEGERAAERMGVSNPLEMAFAAPAIGLAQQEGGRQVFNREGTVLADEAAGLAAANSAGFFLPGLVNPQFGARVEEGRRQQPLAAFAGDVVGGYGPGEIIGAGVAKAAQAIGPGMAAVGRMFSRSPGPNATNAIAGGTLGGIAPAETAEERARNIAVGAGLGYVARPASQAVDRASDRVLGSGNPNLKGVDKKRQAYTFDVGGAKAKVTFEENFPDEADYPRNIPNEIARLQEDVRQEYVSPGYAFSRAVDAIVPDRYNRASLGLSGPKRTLQNHVNVDMGISDKDLTLPQTKQLFEKTFDALEDHAIRHRRPVYYFTGTKQSQMTLYENNIKRRGAPEGYVATIGPNGFYLIRDDLYKDLAPQLEDYGYDVVARTASQPRAAADAMPAGAGDNPYFGRQSMRPPGSGPSPREIETQQQWATATPIVTQARTTAQSAQQAADAALQSKAPADIARAKDQKKTLVGQLQEAQASRAGMDTPEDARLAETLASLSENTSDPVLLSTQISAAKTSLDRLLTDIGSPVEGNLIPVKTNILTRTQAPRSATEGPQDRASVTRYAEGQSDEIKPQGFGAGGPKVNPETLRSAKSEGFDTSRVLYRGMREPLSPDGLYATTTPGYETQGLGVSLSTSAKAAAEYGENVYPVVVKGKFFSEKEYVNRINKLYETQGMGPRDAAVRVRAQLAAEGYAGLKADGGKLLDKGELRVWGDDSGLVPNVKVVNDASGARTIGSSRVAPPIKGMGFGASTPKTPQQAVRFETPGSPEYEAAVAKGLDMSQAGRMGRAKEMGFNEEGFVPQWEAKDYGLGGEWTRKNKQRVFKTAREAEGQIVRTQKAVNEIFGFNPQASDGRLIAARKAMYETPEYKSGNLEEWKKTPEYEAYKQIEKLVDRQAARGNALARTELIAARLGQRLNIPGGRIVGVDEIFGPIKKGKLSPDVTSYGETTVMLPVTRFIDDALQGKNLEKTVRKYIVDEFGEDALLENPREVETYIKSLLNAAEWVRNRKLSDEVESYARWYAGEGTDRAMPGIAAADPTPAEIVPPSIMRVLVKRDKDGNIENMRSVNAAFDPEKSGSSTLLAAAPFAAVGGAGLTSERELGSKMKREKKD